MSRRRPGTTTHALLALLAVRPWSGYELTKQARRSLRYVWPSSEAHLYREQRRLVGLGWAQLRQEYVGERVRRRYSITRTGRAALREWFRTEPDRPALEIEGALRVFFADQGSVDDAVRSLRATADGARAAVDELVAFARAYLAGDVAFPERLHVIAIAMDLLTSTYETIERSSRALADEIGRWKTTANRGMDAETRKRFEKIVERQKGR